MTLQQIQALASDKIERRIRRNFTADEIADMREHYVELGNRIADTKQERKTAVRQFKEQLDELNETSEKVRADLRMGFEDVETPCYVVMNQAEDTVEYYDAVSGVLVETRAIKPGEQVSILTMEKKANG